MRKPRILLADDHAMVIAGLSKLVEPEYDVVGTAENGQALLALAEELRPDVIVVDISMPLLNGLEAVRRMRQTGVQSKIVFLTMHSDPDYALEAVEAGASGFLLKQSAAEELLSAIHEVLQGRSYITPLLSDKIVEATPGHRRPLKRPSKKLTQREREVLQLIAEGKSAKEIAHLLEVSTRTVEFHKYNVMEKLAIRTTAGLTQYAVKHGLISP